MKLITDSREATSRKTPSTPSSIWDMGPSFDQLQSAFEPLLQRTIEKLQQQLKALQDQLKDLQERVESAPIPHSSDQLTDSTPDDGEPWTTVSGSRRRALSDAVRQSVETALHDERCRQDVIICGAEEIDDKKLISDLCSLMDFSTKPTSHRRLGRKGNRPRLLMASFPSAFDARSFIAR